MRKKLVILTCLFCLMFSTIAFANEIKEDKVLSTMDLEGINNSLNKVGLKSVSLNPSEESVYQSYVRFGNGSNAFNTLEDGNSADSYKCYIRVSSSELTQNNVVTFNLPVYGELSGNTSILTGSCDGLELNGRTLKVYNPHDSLPGDASDVIISVPFASAYTNNTGSPITLSLGGLINVYSSGTELLETFLQYFTINQVVVILSAAVGSCITLVFMWWGVRKMAYAIMSAFKKGKLRI